MLVEDHMMTISAFQQGKEDNFVLQCTESTTSRFTSLCTVKFLVSLASLKMCKGENMQNSSLLKCFLKSKDHD